MPSLRKETINLPTSIESAVLDTAVHCKVNNFVVIASRFCKVAYALDGVGHPVEF